MQAVKYDFDQRTGRWRNHANSRRNTRDVCPLSARTTSAGESIDETRTKMCTWSGITSLATIAQPCSSAISMSKEFNRAATRPPSTRRRYFGHHTRCNPSEVTPPALERNRADNMTQGYRSPVTFSGPSGRAPIPLTASSRQGNRGDLMERPGITWTTNKISDRVFLQISHFMCWAKRTTEQ